MSFRRLESLILVHLSIEELLMMSSSSASLPRLYSLNNSLNEEKRILFSTFDVVYQVILSLPFLKHCTVTYTIRWSEFDFEVVLPTVVYQNSSSIETLRIKHPVSTSNILSLFEHTPQIRHLKCEDLTGFDDNDGQLKKLNLLSLKQISIGNCPMTFDSFEVLMQRIGEQVERLKLNVNYYIEYASAKRWQRFIEEYLSRLGIFNMQWPRKMI